MPQVFCLEWLEDDDVLGTREAGCSLHLARGDARAFAMEHQSYEDVPDPEGPYLVEISDELYREVQASPNGIWKRSPRVPNFPRA